MPRIRSNPQKYRWLLLMVTIWAIVLAGYAILRHERLNSSVYDFGIKSQVIWNTANGRWFASSIEVTQYLGDHFQLIFLPLAVLYRLWPNPNALLLVQSLLLALAAIPVYRIANRHLRSQKLALAFAAVYLLYPTIGFINRFDFHPITFVVFFFLMVVDLVETDHPWWASFFIFLALITREEMGLTIFALGLFVIFVEKRPRLGTVWAVVGLVYSAVILLAVMPAFRGGTTDSMLRYAWLGDGPAAMAQTLLTRPAFVLTTLLGDPVRQEFLLKILLPVGFLSLLSPLALAVALPALGYNLLSDVPSQSSIYFQYMSPLIPFIFLAAILGAASLQKWLNGRISPKAASRQFTWGLIIWLGAFTLLAWLLDNPFTTRIDAPYYPIYALEQTSSRAAFDKANALLPADAPVATMMGYGTHLSLRPELYLFYDRLKLMERPYAFPPVEYALLNLTDLRWDVNARIFYSAIETAIGRLGYEALYFQDDVVLLRQTDEPQPATGAVLQRVIDLAEAGGKYAPTAPSTLDWLGRQWVMESLPDTPALSDDQKSLAEVAVSQPILFAEGITLLGYELSEDWYAAGWPLCVTLYWQTDSPQTADYTAFVHLTAPDGYVQAQRDSAPAFGFHPTSQWQPGEITADMHCFRIPPQLPPGPYQIKAGLYDPATGSRLPIQDPAIPATDNAAILTEISIEPANNP